MTQEQNAFGLRVRSARQKAGLSQSDLALRVEVHCHTVHRWERVGSQPKDLITLRRLAAVLGVSADWLVGTESSLPQTDLAAEVSS